MTAKGEDATTGKKEIKKLKVKEETLKDVSVKDRAARELKAGAFALYR